MRFKITDKVEDLPKIAPLRWIDFISRSCAPLCWYWIGVILSVLFAVSLFLRHNEFIKKAWLSTFFLLTSACSILIGFRSYHNIYGKEMAVVQFPSVSILSAPDASGVELFQLHEGVLVEIRASQGAWQNIRLSDGKEGWMSKDAAKGF